MNFHDDKCTEYYKENPPSTIDTKKVIGRLQLIYRVGRGQTEEDLELAEYEDIIRGGVKPEDLKDADEKQSETMIKILCSRWDWLDFEEHVKHPVLRRELENELEKFENRFTYQEYINTRDAIRNKQFEQVRENLKQGDPTKPDDNDNDYTWWKFWR